MLGLRRKARRQAVEAPSGIIADLSGAAISGQVAVGENIVQIHAEHGAIVNYVAPEKRPTPRLRPLPVRRLPRDFPDLLGRTRELAEARAAIDQGGPVEFYGEPGVGKSALVRHLAHRFGEEPRDGTIHMTCEGQPVDDLLQFLFEAFFESDVKVLPTPAELQRYMVERQALLIFDDFELGREELERLMNSVPAAGFLTASTSRRLWGEGRSLALGGLDEPAAIALVEHEVGRALSAAERPAATRLWEALDGRPLRLLRVAALVRDGTVSFGELAGKAPSTASGPNAHAAVDQAAIAALPASEREIFDLLAALPGLALHSDHVAAITGAEEAGLLLQDLEHRGLVQSHSPRYSVAGGIEDSALLERERANELRTAVRLHLAERIAADPDAGRFLAEAETIASLLGRERRANGDEQPEQVLAAARAAEVPLALNGRWGTWAEALHNALDAAEQLRDPAATAWALHQLGSRALCLGDAEAATTQLTHALELREELGDSKGVALTRHNLDRLITGPPGPPARPGPRLPRWPAILGVAAVVAAGAVLAVLAAGGGGGGTTVGGGKTTSGGGGGTTTQGQTTTTQDQTPPTGIDVSTRSLDFGSVVMDSPSRPMVVTVRNTGTEPATVGPAALSGAAGEDFRVEDACGGQPLAAEGECMVAVTFVPPDLDMFSATLTIPTPDGATSISLSGNGISAPSTPTSTSSTTPPTTSAPATTPPTTSGPTTTTTPQIK